MRRSIIVLPLLLSALACRGQSRTAEITVKTVRSGHVAGFAEGTGSPGKPLHFEASSIAKGEDGFYLASDKPIPGHSSLVYIKSSAFTQAKSDASLTTPVDSRVIEASSKIEGLAFGDKHCFGSTDFEWITDKPAEADTYNNLIVWPTGDISKATLIHESARDGIASSRVLRDSFAAALRSEKYPKGPPYYKAEGLEVVGDQILFGIREIGTDYEHPEPCFVVLAADIVSAPASPPSIGKSFRKVIDYSPGIPGISGLRFGLTSLARHGDLFLASTVSEDPSQFRSSLWWFTHDGKQFSEPRLVMGPDSKPLLFNNKIEGVCFSGEHEVILVCDDDRRVVPLPDGATRKPHEAAYFVLTLGGGR